MVPHLHIIVSAHIVSATPAGLISEYLPAYDIRDSLVDPPNITGEHPLLPDRPGHGCEIARDARKEHEIDPALLAVSWARVTEGDDLFIIERSAQV